MDSFRPYGRSGCGGNQNMNRNANQRANTNCSNNRNQGYNTAQKDFDCFDEFLNLNAMPIAMAYVPMQQWEEMYKPSTAICEGTAFPGLNKIFCGVRGK